MVQQQGHTSGRSKSGKAAAQAGHGGVSAAEIEKFTAGIDFPCDKEELLDCARDNHAPREVMDFMEKFPEQSYNSPIDIARHFSQVKH